MRACCATLLMWDRQVMQGLAGWQLLEPETQWIGLLPPSPSCSLTPRLGAIWSWEMVLR